MDVSDVRESINKVMMKQNTIDRLLTDKVEDYVLIQEQPLPILIKDTCRMGGDRVLYVGNFNFDNEDKFFHEWAKIVSNLLARLVNMDLMDKRKNELLEKADFYMLAEGKWMYEFLSMDKWLKKKLCTLLKHTLLKQQSYIMIDANKRVLKKWKNCTYKFFRKNVTKEQLIQICWLIYLYNFDSQKKSLKLVVEKMGLLQLEETYIPFWLQNLGGLTGSFGNAQAQNIDSFYDESENNELNNQDE